MLDNRSIHSLINLANVNSGLLNDNFVDNPDSLNKFKDIKLGIPILIPADKNLFDFEEKDVFEIDKNKLLSIIYNHKNADYIGFKHAFKHFNFISRIKIKKKYEPLLKNFIDQNINTLRNVTNFKKKYKVIGAFQTRNIPHFGHEIIIKRMLKICNHLIINPVIGPKKKGDTTIECLTYVFKNLLEYKYPKKVSFEPILANMFYAGPREAVHHAIIRKNLGFDLFTVGRDHAGAENIYKAHEAPELIETLKTQLGINVMCHYGAKFCKICDKVILLGDCNHENHNLMDISGTNFRESIIKKIIFPQADYKMQKNLFMSDVEIFEK